MVYTYKLEPIPDSCAVCGEAPHWDVATQSLYYVDVHGPYLFRYDYHCKKMYKAKIENEQVSSFIIPIQNATNQFAVGIGRRVKIVEWDGKAPCCKVISDFCEVEGDNPVYSKNRFNDGKCDPFCNRLYAGTMLSDKDNEFKCYGSLYLCKQKKARKLIDNVYLSNGLTWDVIQKKFYYIDSFTYNIKVYDYDVHKGTIHNGKILLDFCCNGMQPEFVPSGLTIDTKGSLYVAMFNGSRVVKINPRIGKIEHIIDLDCKKITSVAFGGPNLDILFITTACFGDPAPAGTLFKCTGLNATGYPMSKLKLDLPKFT